MSNTQCHIHSMLNPLDDVKEIRENICNYGGSLSLFKDNYYCIFHKPTASKNKDEFTARLKQKMTVTDIKIAEINGLPNIAEIKENEKPFHDFRYICFPSVADFHEYDFSVRVNFGTAAFMADADFSSTTFSEDADFTLATFAEGASFRSAVFLSGVYFVSALFSAGSDFSSATFEEKSQTFFIKTEIRDQLVFNYVISKGYLSFEGTQNNRLFAGSGSLLDLQNARINDAKKISFHTVRLEPSWFINVDASNFVFTDCKWEYPDKKRLKVKKELKNLKMREFENPNALLTKVCWQLAANHEESKSFAKSSLFRRFANESKRLRSRWYQQPFTLHWWYCTVSFYGEKWSRAFYVLSLILLIFGITYWSSLTKFDCANQKQSPSVTETGQQITIDNRFHSMELEEAMVYSLSVAAFQRPEPKAADTLTKLLVVLETIFAPLQGALLALAIRRKFMR